MSELIVQPDDRGRLSLGGLTELASRYRVDRLENGQILLDPVDIISTHELELIREHPEQYRQLLAGIEDARQGRHGPRS